MKTMVVLNTKFFQGGGDIPSDRKNSLYTRSDSDITTQTLIKLGWEGQTIASITLKTDVAGTGVKSGLFSLHGMLTAQPIAIQANKLWDKVAKDVVLWVKLPDSAAFQFASGTLCSEYLSSGELQFGFNKAGTEVEEDKWSELGVGFFCLRAVCYLGKTSNGASGPHIKHTVLAVPASVDQQRELSDRTKNAAWPGVKILEGQAQLFPAAPVGCWGAPLFPLLDISDRTVDNNSIPTGEMLRWGLAEIMCRASLPTACTNYGGLSKLTKKMLKDQEMAAPKSPSITWPVHVRPTAPAGKKPVDFGIQLPSNIKLKNIIH